MKSLLSKTLFAIDHATYLKRLGYETGRVILPGFHTPINLNDDTWFRNCGTVTDIDANSRQTLAQVGLTHMYRSEHRRTAKVSGARCTYWTLPGTLFRSSLQGISLCVREQECKHVYQHALGHESTHALIELGREDLLIDLIRGAGYSLNPFERYDPETYDGIEAICDTGGWIALIHSIGTLDSVVGFSYRPQESETRMRMTLQNLRESRI